MAARRRAIEALILLLGHFSAENRPIRTRSSLIIQWALWWSALALLLAFELVVLTLPFNPREGFVGSGFWTGALFFAEQGIRPAFITGAAAAILLSRQVLQREFRRILNESSGRVASARWLAVHLLILGVLIFGTESPRVTLTSITNWEVWLLLWSMVASAALVTWLFCVLPPRFWARWIRQSRSALAAGAAAGLAAYALGNWTRDLWWPLQRSTFELVVFILRLLRQAAVVRPDDLLIGSTRFQVTIGSQCSGLEGVGLICAFIAAYLWACRRELRFPQSFLLFPIGAISIWLLNSVRIATLILIGGWYPKAGVKGFHSAAGWIFFNLVAAGLIWISSQSRLFVRTPGRADRRASPATGYVLPLIVLCLSAVVVGMFSHGAGFYRPVVVIAALAALVLSRSTLLSLRWKPSWGPVLAGVVVFALVALTSNSNVLGATVRTMPDRVPPAATPSMLFFCLLGSAIALPLTQELAFRGYLARKLIAADFDTVSFSRFTWLSFLGSSLAFSITAENWFPAILAGMLFAAVAYRRGLLSDAIIAHVCSGSLLFLFATITNRWSLLIQ